MKGLRWKNWRTWHTEVKKMSSAFLFWFGFVFLTCSLIANVIDEKKMKTRDREIENLRVKNHAVQELNEAYKARIKFLEHSKYYEEI